MKPFFMRVLGFLTAVWPFAAAAEAPPADETVSAVAVIAGMGACCSPEAWPEAERILERELRALGLQVVVASAHGGDERFRRRELQEMTRLHRAACAVRVVRPQEDSGRVEVWVEDRVTHKMLFRQLQTQSGKGERSAEIVALRAVEMLRASLLELQMESTSVSRKASVPREVMRLLAPPARQRPFLDAFVQGGVWFSSGGAPQSFQMQMGILARVTEGLRIGAAGSFAPVQSEIRDVGMSASFQVGDAFVWGFWEPAPSGSGRIRPALGAGAGLLFVRTQGTTDVPGLTNREDTAFVGAGAIRFDLRFRMGPWVSVLASVTAGAAFPEITVRFSDRIAATAGNPFAQMLVGMEMHVF